MVTTYNGSAVPGQFNEPQDAGQTTIPVQTAKRLALVGEFPWLEPATIAEVSSESAMVQQSPSNDTLGLIARIVFDCAKNDAKVTRQPGAVLMVNALASTQASKVLQRSATNVVTAAAREYGAVGNRVKIVVSDGTLTGKKYVITAPGWPTETRDNVGFGNVATFNYTGSNASTMAMAFDTTNGLRISYTETGIALGTLAARDYPCDGTISVTPSVGAGSGQTYTVTITGTSKVDGTVGTAVLNWTNADGTDTHTTGAGSSTGIAQFSSVTSVLFAASSGTPTFSMAGYAFDLPPAASGYSAGYPRAKSLIDRVASFANFTAVSASPAAASIPTNLMDAFSSATIKAAAKSLTADLYALTSTVTSAIVTFTRVSGATGAPTNATYILAGGADGSGNSTTWQAALDALDDETVNVLWMDTDDASLQDLGAVKMTDRLEAGGKACQMHVGAAGGEALAALDARILALDRYTTNLWFQRLNRLDQFGVLRADLAPKYMALTWAAIQSQTAPGTPLTRIKPQVLDYSQASDVNPANNANTLIQHHLCFVGRVNRQIVGVRPVTAYGAGDNRFYDEPGSVESFLMCCNDVQNGIAAVEAVGAADVIFTRASYRQLVQTRLNLQTQPSSRLINRWDPTSLRIDDEGDTLVAYANVQPIGARNFIVTRFTAVAVAA